MWTPPQYIPEAPFKHGEVLASRSLGTYYKVVGVYDVEYRLASLNDQGEVDGSRKPFAIQVGKAERWYVRSKWAPITLGPMVR